MQPFHAGFLCRERRGLARREVHEVAASKETIWWLMEKLEPATSPGKDLRMLEAAGMRILLVDDVGVIIKGNILNLHGWPDVHIGFWDKVLVGREQMCYTIGCVLAQDAGVKGLWTAIPKASRATLAFAKRVGFGITVESPGAYGLEICV